MITYCGECFANEPGFDTITSEENEEVIVCMECGAFNSSKNIPTDRDFDLLEETKDVQYSEG